MVSIKSMSLITVTDKLALFLGHIRFRGLGTRLLVDRTHVHKSVPNSEYYIIAELMNFITLSGKVVRPKPDRLDWSAALAHCCSFCCCLCCVVCTLTCTSQLTTSTPFCHKCWLTLRP